MIVNMDMCHKMMHISVILLLVFCKVHKTVCYFIGIKQAGNLTSFMFMDLADQMRLHQSVAGSIPVFDSKRQNLSKTYTHMADTYEDNNTTVSQGYGYLRLPRSVYTPPFQIYKTSAYLSEGNIQLVLPHDVGKHVAKLMRPTMDVILHSRNAHTGTSIISENKSEAKYDDESMEMPMSEKEEFFQSSSDDNIDDKTGDKLNALVYDTNAYAKRHVKGYKALRKSRDWKPHRETLTQTDLLGLPSMYSKGITPVFDTCFFTLCISTSDVFDPERHVFLHYISSGM